MVNPYELMSPDIIQAGQEALRSGQISPQEAMGNLSPILRALGLGQNPLTNPRQIALTPAQKRLKEQRTMEQAPGFVGPPRPPSPDDDVLNKATDTPGVFEALGVKPVDKGSNEAYKLRFDQTDTNENKLKEGDSQTVTSATAMNPVEFSKAMGNIESLPDIQEQRKGIANLQDMLNMSGAGGGDFVSGPLMGLLKSEFGRDVSGYKAGAGATPEEVTSGLLSGNEKLQTARNNLSQRIGDLLGKQRTGSLVDKVYQETQDNKLQKILTSLGLSSGDTSGKTDNTHIANYHRWNQLALQTMKKDDEQATTLNKLATDIGSGNPIDDARISMIRATLDAGGRPNIAEVRMEAGSKELVTRAQNAWSYLTTGNMADKNRALMVQSIQAIADYQQKVREANIDRLDEMGKHYELTDAERSATLPSTYAKRYPVAEGKPALKTQTKTYDGSTALPKNATKTQKKLRLDYINKMEAGQ
jgi:hypothetical protein